MNGATPMNLPDDQPTQVLSVLRADDITVVDGVAQGDAMTFADELVMDDVYQIKVGSERVSIAVSQTANGLTLDSQTPTGHAGNLVHLDSAVTLMSPDGTTFEALVMVEVEDDAVANIYLLPFAPLAQKIDYRLVGIDRDTAASRFAEVACVSFTRGTHIAMASGAQVPIENLKIGDKVLTRDDGPKEVRWVGSSTVRAVGAFAPIVIRKAVLHNENDLVLSPDHRIFIYQRQDAVGAGRAELLVKVSHLVNGTTVFQQDGGFVEYFQLLFDDHQIIYAEGIAAESLLIDTRTRNALPSDVATDHAPRQHNEFEVTRELLGGENAAEILRKASRS